MVLENSGIFLQMLGCVYMRPRNKRIFPKTLIAEVTLGMDRVGSFPNIWLAVLGAGKQLNISQKMAGCTWDQETME